jgi:hypothetical protein
MNQDRSAIVRVSLSLLRSPTRRNKLFERGIKPEQTIDRNIRRLHFYELIAKSRPR